MKTVSFGNLTDYDAEAQQLDQRKKYAEALRAQGQQQLPGGQIVGNQFVATNPLNYLANALRQYSGAREMADVRAGERALNERKQSDLAEYLKSMPGAKTETAKQLVGDRPGAGSFEDVTTTIMPTAEDYMQWSMRGLQFGPQVAQLGGNMANQAQMREFQNKQLEAQTMERQAAREQRAQELQMRLQDAQLSREQQATLQRELAQMRIDAQRDMARLTASLKQSGGGAQPYFTPVPTTGGIGSFDNRTGQMQIISGPDGKPIVKSSDDPTLQGNLAGAKEAGKLRAKGQVEAEASLPGYVAESEGTIKLVDDLLKHPGKKMAVGGSSVNPLNYVPGTDAKDFRVRLEQIQGKQFLQAFESLKGGGQITEVEGQKATAAISRMNTAQSEKEFDAAAREFQSVIKAGVERAKRKASVPVTPSAPAAPGVPSVDDLLKKYGG